MSKKLFLVILLFLLSAGNVHEGVTGIILSVRVVGADHVFKNSIIN